MVEELDRSSGGKDLRSSGGKARGDFWPTLRSSGGKATSSEREGKPMRGDF